MHSRIAPRAALLLVLIAFCSRLLASGAAQADSTPQTLPFAQAWSDPSMISPPDNWFGVPGVIGIRGDDLTVATGTDPQTILAESAIEDVIPDQSSPSTLTTGGIAEFDAIVDRTVALQGSGTADAPYLQITITTAGVEQVAISYNLRDLDGSTDNAVQPVALQFRVGVSGPFTNVPEGFVADATSGPGSATLVTPVFAMLPAAAGNQPVVQVRIITANAVGSDEWVGIDDIAITNAPTPPSGAGAASPAFLSWGDPTMLTVTVTPGTFPASTGVAVACDLTSIGGAVDVFLYDDGSHGDVAGGDNVFSLETFVAPETPGGGKSIPVTISDAQGRSGETTIALTVILPLDTPADRMPEAFVVREPLPNPFRTTTSIAYELAAPTRIHVSVFDLNGRRVAVLEDGARVPAGLRQVSWAGRDDHGRRVASGVYLCRIVTENDRAVRRMVLID